MSTQTWWYVARSGGIVAWFLLAISTFWGVALSSRFLGKRPKPNWMLDLHRFCGGLATIFTLVHIAGLVAGASKGEGLGNQFLANIRETDAIVNVVRCFEDDNVIHVAGKVDPIADIEVIQTELCLADLSTVEKSLVRYNKTARAGDKEAQALVKVLDKCQASLNEAKPVRSIDFSKEEQVVLRPLCLITAKPAMYVANVAEDGFTGNPLLQRLESFAARVGLLDAGRVAEHGAAQVGGGRSAVPHMPR